MGESRAGTGRSQVSRTVNTWMRKPCTRVGAIGSTTRLHPSVVTPGASARGASRISWATPTRGRPLAGGLPRRIRRLHIRTQAPTGARTWRRTTIGWCAEAPGISRCATRAAATAARIDLETLSTALVSNWWPARKSVREHLIGPGRSNSWKNGKIGFALVGTGMAGQTHARELEFVEDAELVAVCSRNEARVREFADTFNVPFWYTDFRESLKNPTVDVVCVLVPTGQHAEVTIAASNSGKQVLVEKPLEINLERADKIIATCAANKTKLGVIFQMRFGSRRPEAPSRGAVRRDGARFPGRCHRQVERDSRRLCVGWVLLNEELEGGGCLMTQSIHVVDLLQYIVGPIRSVNGRVATMMHDIEVEDTATALVTFENGAIGTIESTSSIRPALKSRVEIHWENGTIVANPQAATKFCSGDVKGLPCADIA